MSSAAAVLPTLTRQRCWMHASREAAARCPGCERFFCRECVTEHEGRFLCAACLRAVLVAAQPMGQGRAKAALLAVGRTFQISGALALTWYFFYLFGQSLNWLPTDFHQTKLWREVAPAFGQPVDDEDDD